MPKAYNPVDKIAELKKKTEDRGYGHFSAKAVELHRAKYKDAEKDQAVLQGMADDAKNAFMASVNDFQAEDHMEKRKQFRDKYAEDPQNVFNAFYQRLCEDNGIGTLPQRDTDYEKKVLAIGIRNPSATEVNDNHIFSQLMRAAWDANGYEDDPQLIAEFNREYKNAGKPSGSSNSAGPGRSSMPGSAIANKMTQLQAKYPAAGDLKEIK